MSNQGHASASYLSEDTIGAIATGLGGPIAIIRVSGPRVAEIFSKISNDPIPEPGKLRRTRIFDDQKRLLDDAMVVFFKNPASFTGEDLFELNVHGGAYQVAKVMGALYRLGVRRALPGEFSFRAVRNGKMTLSQTEAVHDLVQATNSQAASLALEKIVGQQAKWAEALAEEAQHLVAMSELGIDFADQDVEEVSLPALKKRANALRERLGEIQKSFSRGRKIQEGFRAVFLGLPNAGKSSLFNAFLGEDRSIVTAIAGTTRDVVHESLSLQGTHGDVTLRLEDTAGLHSAQDQVEKEGIERTRNAAKTADVLIWIAPLDAASEREGEIMVQNLAREWHALGQPGSKSLLILTKADVKTTYGVRAAEAVEATFGFRRVGETSATTGLGVLEAGRVIADHLAKEVTRAPGEVVLTHLEHAQQLALAEQLLGRALVTEHNDLFAADLRLALTELSPLIGLTLPDDILGRIFSKFCIGK